MAARLVLAVLVLVAVAAGTVRARAWRARLGRPVPTPRLGTDLTAGAERTWVVFTTPFCVACQPVLAWIRTHDPAARVIDVRVDQQPHLARRYRVQTAPTVLVAGASGEVLARLAGDVGPAELSAAGAALL